MEKNKKIIMLSMGIALLVFSVGISFAFFTSRSNINNVTNGVTGDTTTTEDTNLEIKSLQDFDDKEVYPGHQMVSIVRVIATGDNIAVPYNLIWTGTNTFKTPVEYEVYKKDEQLEVNASCVKKVQTVEGIQHLSEDCTISNLSSLGEVISSGTINYSSEEIKEILVKDESITSTKPATSVYYYIVMKYPNLDKAQDDDLRATFKGVVNIEKNDTKSDVDIVAVYLGEDDGTYKQAEDIPTEGYIFNSEKSTCSNGATPNWVENGLFISELTKRGTSCSLYFEPTIKHINTALGTLTVNMIPPDFSSVATTDEGIFQATDETGKPTYYYRGAVENNYLKFADKWWRIIRINGDGTIRIIYDGTSYHANGTSTTDNLINNGATYTFSKSGASNDNAYVGFMYGTTGGSDYKATHANTNKSNAMEQLETWYTTNLASYSDKIDTNTGFCGDRRSSTNENATKSDGAGGVGTTVTYYGAYLRIVNSKNPSLTCEDNDLYTVTGASKGNKAMTYPIGLITADELVMAGGVVGSNNTSYYLYNGHSYWTMSPSRYVSYSTVWSAYLTGECSWSGLSNAFGIRSVINLKADVSITGSGTQNDPYVVS
ncbi:MAG: hypothetical protein K2J20_06965 [Bacilli bacterium]|nr:hypothetical protein [Bacilli bacterium]